MRIIHEKIGTFGGITADAIANLLNGSDVDLATFLRETIQNSWDARVGGGVKVISNLRFAKISTHGKRAILECVASDDKLDNALLQQALETNVLIYSDRGTTGLNGPISVPSPHDGGASSSVKPNFANFVWMLGANDGGQNMGGQFGFGKSVFAGASQIKMYAIHTRVITGQTKEGENKFAHRFVICGMRRADQKTQKGRGYTGRYWIGADGSVDDHSIVALNEKARKMAAWFGIDFIDDDDKTETGTNVAIIQPKWSGSNQDHFLRMARQATVKWFWPLLWENNFEFTTGDDQVTSLEKAKIDGGYAVFAELFEECKKIDRDVSRQTPRQLIEGKELRALMDDGNVRVVCCLKPFKPLGILGMATQIATDARLKDWGQNPLQFITEADFDGDSQTTEELPDPVNTLALIRSPRMVVSYERIDHSAGPKKTVFGVFVAASRDMHQRIGWDGYIVKDAMRDFAVEDILAKSEPPRHDEWNPVNISSDKARLIAGGADVSSNILANFKTIAKSAVLKSKDIFEKWCRPAEVRPLGAFEFVPAGEASQFLSKHVFKTLGDGIGIGPIVTGEDDGKGGNTGGDDGKGGNTGGDDGKGGNTGGDDGKGGNTGGDDGKGGNTGGDDGKGGNTGGDDGKGGNTGNDKKTTKKVALPNLKELTTIEMTETQDGKILFTTKINVSWSSNEEFIVRADISLIDGDGKKSKLKNLAPINGAADSVTFADFSDEEKKELRDNDEVKSDFLKASESHGFFKGNETRQSQFLDDGMSVIIKGGVNFTHKLLTTPGKVLDISFVAEIPKAQN